MKRIIMDRNTNRQGVWRRRLVAAGAITVAVGTAYAVPGTPSASGAIASYPAAPGGFLRSHFLIGTWEQPISSRQHSGTSATGVSNNFAYWKSLGVNTLVEIPQLGYSAAQYVAWDQAAAKVGLYEMRRPFADNPSADSSGRNASNMIAWNLPDEPDKAQAPAHMTPAQIQSLHDADKQANPSRPVYLSLVGNLLMCGSCLTTASSLGGPEKPYGAALSSSDWLSADDYPVDAGHNPPISIIAREMSGLFQVGSRYAGRMAFIETGHIGNTTRTPVSAAQMKAEIWESVVHGARGIIYFSDTTPQVKNSAGQWTTPTTTYDNTGPSTRNIPATMKSQNALLASLTGVLQGTINPSGISVSVPAPLDAGWRANASGKYFIVVNTSATQVRKSFKFNGVGVNKNASVVQERRNVWINGSGYGTDTFAPYAVHIYKVS